MVVLAERAAQRQMTLDAIHMLRGGARETASHMWCCCMQAHEPGAAVATLVMRQTHMDLAHPEGLRVHYICQVVN